MTELEDEQTRVLHQMGSMIIHILRSPPLPISFPSLSLRLLPSPPSSSNSSSSSPHMSPAAFGLLFIGISIALMLFGSVTFLIGLFLMPLVITLVLLFYFAGIVSSLSEIGRSLLWPTPPPVAVAVADSNDKVALAPASPAWNYAS